MTAYLIYRAELAPVVDLTSSVSGAVAGALRGAPAFFYGVDTMTQKDQILAALKEGVKTNVDLNKICFRYSARVYELRKEGHLIRISRPDGGRSSLRRYEYLNGPTHGERVEAEEEAPDYERLELYAEKWDRKERREAQAGQGQLFNTNPRDD